MWLPRGLSRLALIAMVSALPVVDLMARNTFSWWKWKRPPLTIRTDLHVWGDGWYRGELVLSDAVSGQELIFDPVTGELRFHIKDSWESLWFEPGLLGISGGIALGYTDAPVEGLIRWTGEDFEGFDGLDWVSLTGGDAVAGPPPPPPGPPVPPISEAQIQTWDLAFSWGDHRQEHYLRTESDPVFSASPAALLTSGDLANLAAAFHWGDHAAVGYLTAESDPAFSASPASGITNQQIQQWASAFAWGDHREAGYLAGESDPTVQSTTVGAIPQWNGEALIDSLLRVEGETVRIAGALEADGEVVIRRMPRQGDIFMGPFGRPEDAGPGQ